MLGGVALDGAVQPGHVEIQGAERGRFAGAWGGGDTSNEPNGGSPRKQWGQWGQMGAVRESGPEEIKVNCGRGQKMEDGEGGVVMGGFGDWWGRSWPRSAEE